MPEIMGGVRILDFTQEIQGPWGTAILADMGAEVIKVERRETGELSRGAVSPDNPELQGLSPYFTVHNRGKKSITLDLKRPEAVRIVHQIAATSDVVVNNWRPNVLDRLGFGYRQLRETKPDIIFVTASAFGARGPWSARPGRDILGQSIGGIVSVTGTAAEPHPAGAAVADHTAGIVEALSVLAALRYRDQTGEGQEVDISLYGTVIAMQAWEITHHALTGRKLTHAGRGHTLIGVGTWGVFPTADGHLSLAGVLPDRWEEFCGLLDAPALGQDSRFTTLQGLTEHADALHAALDKIFVRRPTQAWLDLLEPAEILVAPVHDYAEIVQSEQARVNGYIQELDHPTLGPLPVVGAPVEMSEARIAPRGPAPELGQHTEELLLELGYDWDQITQLRDDAVI